MKSTHDPVAVFRWEDYPDGGIIFPKETPPPKTDHKQYMKDYRVKKKLEKIADQPQQN
jgi:hypothetical protein